MKPRVVVLIVGIWLGSVACQTVAVQVPPEADLQGIKTVAVQATDLPSDPIPVAVLLRSEASSRIRRLLPHLTLVEPTANADAVLRMQVVRHSVGAPSLRVSTDPQSGRVSCAAWQIASLLVDGSVVTGEVIRWQGLLESERRVDLPCLRAGGVLIAGTSAEAIAPRQVRDIVDELGRRLAGYERREIRRNPGSGPKPSPLPTHQP